MYDLHKAELDNDVAPTLTPQKLLRKVLVSVPLLVHYRNYWTEGCDRKDNTAGSKCCITLLTKHLHPIIPIVHKRKRYMNGLLY